MFDSYSVYLRALELEDYNISVKWRMDEETWELLYGPRYYVSPEYEKKWIEGAIFSQKDIRLAVCLKKENKLIGFINLMGVDMIYRNAELSVWIGDKECRNKAYGMQACLLIMQFGFYERGLERISARALESHKVTRKGLLFMGFKEEGLLRNAVYKNGRFQNTIIYSILSSEFNEETAAKFHLKPKNSKGSDKNDQDNI